jgi:hypothetical protein
VTHPAQPEQPHPGNRGSVHDAADPSTSACDACAARCVLGQFGLPPRSAARACGRLDLLPLEPGQVCGCQVGSAVPTPACAGERGGKGCQACKPQQAGKPDEQGGGGEHPAWDILQRRIGLTRWSDHFELPVSRHLLPGERRATEVSVTPLHAHRLRRVTGQAIAGRDRCRTDGGRSGDPGSRFCRRHRRRDGGATAKLEGGGGRGAPAPHAATDSASLRAVRPAAVGR